MRFWQSKTLILCLILLVATGAWATETRTIVLDDSLEAPQWELLRPSASGATVRLAIPDLTIHDVDQGGEAFAEIEALGGELVGQPGRPALPVLSRLFAVPDGMTLRVVGISAQEQTLEGTLRPIPAQRIADSGSKSFDFDRAWYSDTSKAAGIQRVEVGTPARMHGVRVVPVAFHPVTWDRTTHLATAARRIEAEFEFVPSNEGDKGLTAARPLPESFATLLQQTTLGFDKSKFETVPLGSWVIISQNDPAVIAAIQPLIDWRERQGYHVIATTTSETGGTAAAIKTYLQNLYQGLKTPLEMVVLVGDADGSVAIPTWEENLSGYTGEGDHPYTQLDGGDVLADVHLGRLSASSTTELTNIVTKIVKYENDPWLTDDTDWFTRAGLTGDPSSSGYSTIWVNQFVKEQLQSMNYTQIDTIWSGNFVSQMMGTIGAGESLFTYRGYWNMSGLNTGYISSLGNQQKLPYAVILTCDTGSFWSDPVCRSEAFLRAANGGGVGSIGTATTGTHTRYNNSMFLGIVQNVLASGDPRFGPSLTAGKLNMYNNYIVTEPQEVEIWSTWNNLMGDPATAMWSAQPAPLTVTLPTALTSSATGVEVLVEASGLPVPNAIVAAYLEGAVSVHAKTGADGRVVLPLAGLVDGELLVTVTGVNLKPWLGGVNIGAQTISLNPAAPVLDDDLIGSSAGDSDGLAEAGETIEIVVPLDNHGTGGAADVTATLTSPVGEVTVVQDASAYGYINSGAQANGDVAFVVEIAADVAGGTVVPLDLVATSASQNFTGLVQLEVAGPAARVASSQLAGGAGMNPGDTGTVRVTLVNSGNLPTTGAALTLSSIDNWVSVVDGAGTLPAVSVSGSANNAADLFTISVAGDCIPGHLAILSLEVVFDEGGTAQLEVPLSFGTAASTDPAGPGVYPYYAFDDTDAAYAQAPTYDWVEIDPAVGGAGTSVGLTDFGRYQDDTKTVDLPFGFGFYGQDFDKISICSNGWFAFGNTYQRFYRNWAMPAPGSPDNMVSVFWDELYLASGDGGVFTWYDAANHRFVIEWRRLRNYEGDSLETFQAILKDPAYESGDTGDGQILLQYATVNQVDAENGYATVGIQNEDRSDGLLYTYWNQYPGGAAALTAGRAILLTTVQAQIQGTLAGHVTNQTAGGTPVEGATISVLGSSRNLVTATTGDYLGGVPIGLYDVAIDHPSFAPDTTYGVAVVEGLTTTVDFSLVDVAGPLFSGTVVPDPGNDTTGPYSVTTTITDETGIDATHGYYTSSTTGGPFELALTPTGTVDEFEMAIPGQPAGSRVQFWFTGQDLALNASVSPTGGPFAPYSFVVTNSVQVFSDDMETVNGWTAGAAGDDASSGLWELADPNGVADGADQIVPEDDHSVPGSMCWITGNDPLGSSQGVDDVDSGLTTLLSPTIDVTGFSGLELRYWRWYTNNTGYSPNEDSWQVQVAFDGGAWLDVENTTASDRSWSEQAFLLESIAPGLGSQMQLRFLASDYGSGSVVEAGLDDLTVTGFNLPFESALPTVELMAPDGGEILAVDELYNISWTHDDDIGVVEARLWLSPDSGSSWEEIQSGAFNQSYLWQVPNLPLTTCRLRVEVLDSAGNLSSDESAADFTINGSSPVGDLPRQQLSLGQNTPNPFNPQTDIRFTLPSKGDVSLCIYNVQGKLIHTLVAGAMPAGPHTVTWSGRDDRGGRVASGLYFYRLRTDQGTRVRKMTLLK